MQQHALNNRRYCLKITVCLLTEASWRRDVPPQEINYGNLGLGSKCQLTALLDARSDLDVGGRPATAGYDMHWSCAEREWKWRYWLRESCLLAARHSVAQVTSVFMQWQWNISWCVKVSRGWAGEVVLAVTGGNWNRSDCRNSHWLCLQNIYDVNCFVCGYEHTCHHFAPVTARTVSNFVMTLHESF